jgi:hypothetical protein
LVFGLWREMFSALDEPVHGTVRFGDGFVVKIHGRGTVMFECLTGDHRVLADVYFILSLRSNIVSGSWTRMDARSPSRMASCASWTSHARCSPA